MIYGDEGYSDHDTGLPSIAELFDRPITLDAANEITENVYSYFLNVLPPIYVAGGFAMCEADSTLANGRTVRSTFTQRGGKYFHSYQVY